jgi:hypothetical protein
MRIDLQTLWIWIRRVNATGGPKSVGLRAKFLECRTQNYYRVNGALMSAPEENSLFCFPMCSETESRETLRFEGKQNKLFSSENIYRLLYSILTIYALKYIRSVDLYFRLF